MNKCAAIKRDGGRCERIVGAEHQYCYSHDPTRQEERRSNAAKGGKAKAASLGEIARIKVQLQNLAKSTLAGETDTRVAAVVTQVLNTHISAVRAEMKAKELEEHEQRLAELEELAATRQPLRGGRARTP